MDSDFLHSTRRTAWRMTAAVVACALAAAVSAAQPGIRQHGTITSFTLPDEAAQLARDHVDFVHARPLPMPVASSFSPDVARSELIGLLSSAASANSRAGFVRGQVGDGQEHPQFVGKPDLADAGNTGGGAISQEFGSSNLPFSTARADGTTGSTNKTYPFRAAGKLFFQDGATTFICSASLIGKGLVLTAAHCVNLFGKNHFYTGFRFIPGYKNGAAPYGTWTAKTIYVLAAYVNGSDSCAQSGVVCKDDMAVMVLNAQSGKYPGTNTGFYGYGWDGAGFTSSKLTHVTQIGYPACLDNGEIMERNDSQGATSASMSNNTVIGSLMCGGSSGGPWLVNFGARPKLTGTTAGSEAEVNTVIGVTSWGSSSSTPKNQGAAPFLSTNIKSLANTACGANAGAC